MYDNYVLLKIGRISEGAAKFRDKGLFGQIWVFVMLQFCDFEVRVMLPISKILSHRSLIILSDSYI